jgi:hypothetical protein
MVLALLLVVIGTEPLLTKLMGANGPAWLAPLLLAGSFAGLGFLMLADRLTDRIAHWRVMHRALARDWLGGTPLRGHKAPHAD